MAKKITKREVFSILEFYTLFKKKGIKNSKIITIIEEILETGKSKKTYNDVINLYNDPYDEGAWISVKSSSLKEVVKDFRSGGLLPTEVKNFSDNITRAILYTLKGLEANSPDKIKKAMSSTQLIFTLSRGLGYSHSIITKALEILLPGRISDKSRKMITVFEETLLDLELEEYFQECLPNLPKITERPEVETNAGGASRAISYAEVYQILGLYPLVKPRSRSVVKDILRILDSELSIHTVRGIIRAYKNLGESTLSECQKKEIRRFLKGEKPPRRLFDERLPEHVIKSIVRILAFYLEEGEPIETLNSLPREELKAIGEVFSIGHLGVREILSVLLEKPISGTRFEKRVYKIFEGDKFSYYRFFPEEKEQELPKELKEDLEIPEAFFPNEEHREEVWRECGGAIIKAFRKASETALRKKFGLTMKK